MKINGKLLQMEVDTGAAVSIISEQTKNRLNLTVPLASPSVVLRTYAGEAMSVLGEMKVEVEYKDQLTLMVVKGDGPNHFGRDWLQSIRLENHWHCNTRQGPFPSTVSEEQVQTSFCQGVGYHEEV